MVPSDISRTESVSSQLSGRIDDESMSSGEMSEQLTMKNDAEKITNHLNNNLTAEKTPNGTAAVQPKSTSASPKKEPEKAEAKSVPVTSSSDDIKPEDQVTAETSKDNDIPSSKPSVSESPSENDVEVASISTENSTENTSEETDQLADLPASATPISVSNDSPSSLSHPGVNACDSLSSIFEKSQSNDKPSGIEAKKSADTEKSEDTESNRSESAGDSKADEQSRPQCDRGTSFNSMKKIPPELAAANKAAKEVAKAAEPIQELPTDEALALDMLDEVLSSDLANESTKPLTARSISHTSDQSSVIAVPSDSLPSVITEGTDEVFAKSESTDKPSKQEVGMSNTHSKPMNGNGLHLQPNGTQVLILAAAAITVVEVHINTPQICRIVHKWIAKYDELSLKCCDWFTNKLRILT